MRLPGVEAVASPGLAAEEAVGEPGEDRRRREQEVEPIARAAWGWRALRGLRSCEAAAAGEDGLRAGEGEGARGRGRVREEVRVSAGQLACEGGGRE